MNAAERRAVALKFRSSQKVKDAEDWSNNPSYNNPKPKFSLPHNPEDPQFRHGLKPERDTPWIPEREFTYKEIANKRDPTSDNPNSEYYDLTQHPECAPDMPPYRPCEVALLFKNPAPDPCHKHPLLHTLHSEYADIGESVKRNYDADLTKVCGISTKKLAGDTASEQLSGVYLDKGYVIKNRGEIVPETIKRHLIKTFSEEIPLDKQEMSAAGVIIDKGDRAKNVLSTGYGTQLPNFDLTVKVTRNLDTDLSIAHGFKQKRDGEKPVCLGGKRDGGDLNVYRRQ
ncbi:hypothetical protein SS50377_20769 [Spironucleus salmonicida]|uniref:Uncharacterized protein n=1 Tax=Spironucleus salmonicida TaxID=348837 RepID=V6LR13_9EUKA|nr:hypothetical protein SS50377_20769 [Spironucleus salmonicida]|eukprot:EST47122.1 Hypothetical protein SS50377_12831 [Spironucleus salmonicida]